MEFVVIFAAVLAVAQGDRSPPSAAECSSLNDGQSLLASMLHVLGYNETCVAATLDYCSSAQEDGDWAILVEKARGTAPQDNMVVNKSESRPRHCKDLLDSGDTGSGLRQVYPYTEERTYHTTFVTVFCDQETDGGGWTVFQRRTNNFPRLDFYRRWREYQAGFGDVEGEFWIGLNFLHELAKTPQELRVDLDDYDGEHRWAKYGTFKVGSEGTNYRLDIGRYSGDAGDAMTYNNGRQFSTRDHGSTSCARQDRGGWWYGSCTLANLNGYQHVGSFTGSSSEEGIIWHQWRGHGYSLKRTAMMVRPAD